MRACLLGDKIGLHFAALTFGRLGIQCRFELCPVSGPRGRTRTIVFTQERMFAALINLQHPC